MRQEQENGKNGRNILALVQYQFIISMIYGLKLFLIPSITDPRIVAFIFVAEVFTVLFAAWFYTNDKRSLIQAVKVFTEAIVYAFLFVSPLSLDAIPFLMIASIVPVVEIDVVLSLRRALKEIYM